MDKKTLKITQGALLTAVFAALVLINRQTAGILDGVLVYAYAIPITIYTAWYGLKTSAIAAAAMVLLAFFLGTPSYALYACGSLAIGIVFGQCLYKKVSAEKTILWIMLTAILVSLAELAITVFVSGVSLDAEAEQMQEMMAQSMEKFGAAFNEETKEQMDSIFTIYTLRRILLISQALSGALQGFITYLVGSLIMRKLRIKVPKPKSIYELRPPKWTGIVAMAIFLICNMILIQLIKDEEARSICLIIGAMSYIYLIIFGVIGAYVLLYIHVTRHKALAVIISILGMLILPYAIMMIGFVYIVDLGGLFPVPAEPETPQVQPEQGSSPEQQDPTAT